MRRGEAGVLMAQRNVGAIPTLEIVTFDAAAKAKLKVLRSPAPITVRKAVDLLEQGLVEQADRTEEIIPIFLEREAVPNEPRRFFRPRIIRPHRQVIHIVDTDIVRGVARQQKPTICQTPAAERRVAGLLDDVDRNSDLPIELVALEISDDVRNE